MMSHSIYFRNFFITTLILIVSFALLGGLFATWLYNRQRRDNEEFMSAILQETARYAITQHVINDVPLNDRSLSLMLSMISEVSGYDILLTNADGIVYACSERDFRFLGRQIQLSTLQELSITNQKMTISSLDHVYYEQRDVMAVPLMAIRDNETILLGYLLLTSQLIVFVDIWQGAMSVFVYMVVFVLLVTLIIAFFVIKRQAVPINKMAGVARHFARRDFTARVDDFGRLDEIWQLAQAFNLMAESLESSEAFHRDFIANLSHELKTPMTVIAGFAEGLIDGTIPQDSAEHYLGIVSSETRRLSRLVESMLDMSIFESSEIKGVLNRKFNLSELTRRALLSLDSKIEERGLDVSVNLPDEDIVVRGDEDSITQVLYNLLGNAIKYSPENEVIGLRLWTQGRRAYVSIENSGETLPADELPHIFERFYKRDKSRGVDKEGVGLGLYIVKTILDKHKESIYVTSTNGQTKFIFTLTIV